MAIETEDIRNISGMIGVSTLLTNRIWLWLVVVCCLNLMSDVSGHSGGIDTHGCHNERATANYHCHQGFHAGQVFSSKDEALDFFADEGKSSDTRVGSPAYVRDLYGGWIDADGDCQDTRQEMLIAQAASYELDASGCRVTRGVWIGRHTGKRFTDPSDLHIDHVVALKEAHVSGAEEWNDAQRRKFANDFDNLLVVHASENLSKGSRGPEDWLPDTGPCVYLQIWVATKEKWALEMDQSERVAIDEAGSICR
jgi:hypothetical protein